jgi:predicted metalloendopeptidase
MHGSAISASLAKTDSTFIDASVSPCVDFYQYAVGGWLERTTVTPTDTAADHIWGITTVRDRVGIFSEIAQHTRGTLLHVLEQAQAEAVKTTDPIVRVVGNFYGSCMNAPATDDAGQPLSIAAHQWQCFGATDSLLAPALGALYTRTMLPPSRRAQAEAFGKTLTVAVKHRITQATWLSDSSRANALHKLAGYTIQIGAPPLTEDYGPLTLSATDYTKNRQALKDFLYREQLNTIGHATEGWNFKPWVINSTEHESTKVVELSAVMWQPPLFDFGGDPAVNYGALGVLISHEFMHAFGNVNRAWLDPDYQKKFSSSFQRLM